MDFATLISSTGFFSGVAFAALLLCAGLGIGLVLGRQRSAGRTPETFDPRQAAQTLETMRQWTQSFSHEMTAYRDLVRGVATRFRDAETGLRIPDPAAAHALLVQVAEANESLERRLVTAEASLRRQAVELDTYMSEARTDALTGIPNRRGFETELERRVAEWRRHGTVFSVLLVDVDHFKAFNDRHGHLVGDQVLTHVARALQETLRQSDVVARFGGEEFAVVMPHSDLWEAGRAATRVREAVERLAVVVHGEALRVTISGGVAQARAEEVPRELIQRADLALYAAKAAGRNCIFFQDGRQCLPVERCPATPRDSRPDCEAARGHVAFVSVCDELRRRLDQVLLQQE